MVKVGFFYSFEAQNVQGKEIDHWYVNDRQTSILWDGEVHFAYTIDKDDIDSNNTINVRFSKKS